MLWVLMSPLLGDVLSVFVDESIVRNLRADTAKGRGRGESVGWLVRAPEMVWNGRTMLGRVSLQYGEGDLLLVPGFKEHGTKVTPSNGIICQGEFVEMHMVAPEGMRPHQRSEADPITYDTNKRVPEPRAAAA